MVKTKVKKQTGKKAAILLGALVTLSLMLGVLIQLTLLAQREREGRQAGETLLRAMGETAVSLVESRKALERETVLAAQTALQGQAERRARALRYEQPELLILVNPWHELPEDYTAELQQVGREFGTDYKLDVRCAELLEKMIADCREAGGHPWICSAYRTQRYQKDLFDNKVLRVILEGASREEAPDIAARSVARPGTSEHQLGLAVDIIDENYPRLDEGQEATATQAWLMENCWRYGFILRYPNGTTDITGIIYEPWHYRYVGTYYAETITRLGVTLEEFLDMRREMPEATVEE